MLDLQKNKTLEKYFILIFILIEHPELRDKEIKEIDINKLIEKKNITEADFKFLNTFIKKMIDKIPQMDVNYDLNKEYQLFHYGLIFFPFIFGIFLDLRFF